MSKKTVVSVDLFCSKCRKKVMKSIAGIEGINSIALDPSKSTATIVGDADPAKILKKLRKFRRSATFVSIGPAKEEKKDEKKDSVPICLPKTCQKCNVCLEFEMIHKAHKSGRLTTPYAFNPNEAISMAKAGANVIVAHVGLTTSGSTGDGVVSAQAIVDAAVGINPNVIVLCHGGRISGPTEAEFTLKSMKRVHGFYCASLSRSINASLSREVATATHLQFVILHLTTDSDIQAFYGDIHFSSAISFEWGDEDHHFTKNQHGFRPNSLGA